MYAHKAMSLEQSEAEMVRVCCFKLAWNASEQGCTHHASFCHCLWPAVIQLAMNAFGCCLKQRLRLGHCIRSIGHSKTLWTSPCRCAPNTSLRGADNHLHIYLGLWALQHGHLRAVLAGRRHAHRSGLGVRSLTFGGRPKNITARSNIQRFHTLPPSPSLPSWWSRPRPSGKHLLSSFTCNSTGYLIWPLWATPHHCLPWQEISGVLYVGFVAWSFGQKAARTLTFVSRQQWPNGFAFGDEYCYLVKLVFFWVLATFKLKLNGN